MATTVKCTGLSAGLYLFEDPVLTVSGELPDGGGVVEVELTQEQVAWLMVRARQLDPVMWVLTAANAEMEALAE